MTGEFATAVHALVYLNHKQQSLSSEELAKNVCTNPARIRKVMAKLKRVGLIDTKEGSVGGYRFTLDPKEVSLKDICEAMEITVISSNYRTGDPDMDCLVASGMADVMENIYADLNENSLRQLEQITIDTIDQKIFGKKKG